MPRLALSSLSQLGATPFKQARESLFAKVQTLLPRRENENLKRLTQTLSLDIPTRAYPTPFLDQLLEGTRVQRTEAGEGSLSLRLRPEEYNWLVRILLSFGTDTKVLESETLRMRLQQQAQEMADSCKKGDIGLSPFPCYTLFVSSAERRKNLPFS